MIPLPVVEQFNLKLLTSKKVIKLRPYLIAEEKILTMGAESGEEALIDSLIQVVQNCIINPKDIDVNKMAIQDFMWILIYLRKSSKGSAIDLSMTCKDEKCQKMNENDIFNTENISVNLDNVIFFNDIPLKDFKSDQHFLMSSNIIKITDEIAIEMIPTYVGYVKGILAEESDSKKNLA